MAPEFDDSPTMERMKFAGAQNLWDTSEDLDIGLGVMMSCVNILFRARAEGKIVFAAGVTGKMLEVMGVLLTGASRLKGSKREDLFHRWLKAGTYIADDLIEKAVARPGKQLLPEDLATFVDCPDGYEI
jgi:hypothetical protein